MIDWEPATETEAALSEALRTGDQELYFRILARLDLLLPVAEEVPGREPAGWGTWTTGGRTHVLAFTSVEAMRTCLSDHAGSARKVPYHDLAAAWPNEEWWLAINPGLAIEGYLPAWFVAQLARGEVRLPGRTIGARARVEAAAAARARGAAPIPISELAGSTTLSGAPLAAAIAARRAAAAHAAEQRGAAGRPLGALRGLASPADNGAAAPHRGPGQLPAANPPGQLPAANPPGQLPAANPPGQLPAANPPGQPAPPAYRINERSPAGSGSPATPGTPADRPPAGTQYPPARYAATHSAAVPPMRTVPPEFPSRDAAGRGVPPRNPALRDPGHRDPAHQDLAYRDPARDRGGRNDSPPVSPLAPAPLPTVPVVPEPLPPLPTVPPASALPPRVPPRAAATPEGTIPRGTARAVPPGPARRPELTDQRAPLSQSPTSPAGPRASASVRAPLARGADPRSRPSAESIGRAGVPAHAAAPDPADQHSEPDFVPDNDVEANLLAAASDGQTDAFLSTLLLARVLVPVAPGGSASTLPGQPGFQWRREQVDGAPFVVVFTSKARMAEHLAAGTEAVTVKFVQLIRAWPDESWSFAVNPGTPVGATLPGAQIRALASWAAEVGLSDEPTVAWEHVEAPTRPQPERPVVMQKPVAPTQVAYFLDRGYDRVSGFVHRAGEAAHLTTLEELYAALGLTYPSSPFKAGDDELYLLRWTAYRPNLYRIPYGGRDEAGMRAMQGWMIERAPFRGNGFAPSESSDVIAEFKVDSARLPHGAQMWRLSAAGETLVARLDADGPRWLPVATDPQPDPSTPVPPASPAAPASPVPAANPAPSADGSAAPADTTETETVMGGQP